MELALGVVTDPELGPLLWWAPGECWSSCSPTGQWRCRRCPRRSPASWYDSLRVRKLLAGVRGAPPADLDAVTAAIVGLSALALELGSELAALDVNPLICGPAGAVAVDALAMTRTLR